jgi:hypothetical protein
MGRHGWGLTLQETGKRYSAGVRQRVHGVIESLGRWRPPVLMIETLMGLPPGWLRPEETLSSRTLPNTSGERSSNT